MYKPNPYVDLTTEEIQIQCDQFVQMWELFLKAEKENATYGKDYFIHEKNLVEIIRRCDKRRVYMAVFHDLNDMCEYKAVAIEAFWIITLKPIMVVNPKLGIYSCPNEMFALYKILSVIRMAYEKENPGKPFAYPSRKRIKDILYDFKYCSFSREAMISFVETFADVYGVGISHIFQTIP